MNGQPLIVVKVGGSLFDLPDLKPRLRRFVRNLKASRLLLVPGGGEPADYIRKLQPLHGFSEKRSHDLALAAMSFQGRILAEFFPRAPLAELPEEMAAAWASAKLPILEPTFMLELIELAHEVRLPKDWSFTSDSVAAAVAVYLQADKLILLKSCTAKPNRGWKELAADGVVDPQFPRLAGKLPCVQLVDFRSKR